MNLYLKTLLLIPIIFVIGTLFYVTLLTVLVVAYFLGLVMLPTKIYGYLKELQDYRRIQK
jgi:hypothetical protein